MLAVPTMPMLAMPAMPTLPAARLPAFLTTRKGIFAVIAVVILLIAGFIALTWTYTPGFYTTLGLRHDTSLETYVGALHTVAIEQHPTNLTSWSVTWLNTTAVKVIWAYTYGGNGTGGNGSVISYQESFVMTNCFGTKAASDYVGSLNNGTYRLMSTSYGGSGAYDLAFGHPPGTFAEYRQDQGPVGNFIWQFDEFVQVGSLTRTYAA